MKLSRVGTSVAMTAIAALTLVGCAAGGEQGGNEGGSELPKYSPAEQLSGKLSATGASSQEKAQVAWLADYAGIQSGVDVKYEATGSGTGRDNFVAGTSNFIGSDRAFKAEELAENKFAVCKDGTDLVEIPVYISPIAIAYNLPEVEALNLDADTIAKIFDGKIEKWNDPAIAALNEGVELPDTKITPVHRGDDSGTTENFMDYLSEVAPESWTYEADKVWPAEIKGGEAAEQTAGVAAAIEGGEGTIGYLDASAAGELQTAAVKSGEEFVEYTPEAAAAIVENSKLEEGRAATDLAYELNFEGGNGGYPIVLVSYLIGCAEYQDAETGKLVKDYFSYVISPAAQALAAEKAGSAPISDGIREKAQAAVDAIK